MKRLGNLLNAIILGIAARIIWQAIRQPVPAGGGKQSADAASDASMSAPTSPSATEDSSAFPTDDAAGDSLLPTDEVAPESAAPDDLGERQAVAAEARFSPAFRVEIDGAEPSPSTEPESSAPESTEADVPVMWAGADATNAPTARDLDLATPPDPISGPTTPAGAIPGDGTATCPDDHPIKGNASSMIFHQPGQPSYERTVAEYCFASAEVAEAAGYRAPRR